MRRTKEQKAITLISLIITIVVLLVLAVTAIISIQNDGIISHAGNATKDYNQAAKNEQDMLQQYVNYLNGHTGSSNNGGSGEDSGDDDVVTGTGNWTQTGTTVTNGTVTLTVGDTVTNYDESTKEDGTTISGLTNVEWKVLGAENGKILLFSTDDVKSSHSLSGKDGYNNGISALNTICADYGNGKFAESARTVTVDDINRVTGYNPAATGDGNPYGKGNPNQYGNEVTYTLDADGKVAYTSTAKSGTTTYTKFEHVDGRTLTADNPITVTSNSYYYYPNTLTTSSSGTTKGIATDSAAYLMLFKEATNTSTNTSYWLGSSDVNASSGYASFGLRSVRDGNVWCYYLWYSDGGADPNSSGVRAVVSLKSDVQVTSNGTNSWALSYEA